MVVQHNLQAMNANRMLNVTTNAQSKSTEKLSSGYRINRAADDAAGLSISEKMRKQIRGLSQASTNAQDGISAVQTAEGALTEVHSMLQRMNELATQSANGTNSETDRQAIQDEIDQLTSEIDRVSETTKFNETYLHKGDSRTAEKASFIHSGYALGDDDLYAEGDANKTALTAETLKEAIDAGKKIYKSDDDSLATKGTDYAYVTKLYDAEGNSVSAEDALKAVADDPNTKFYATDKGDAGLEVKNATNNYDAAANQGFIQQFDVNGKLSFNLHVGADSSSDNKISVDVESMSAAGIGVKGLKVNTEDDATVAIDRISEAIQKVSSQRSSLGAVQNRLEHTISNLDNVVENTTSAESRIRDTDMAEEMVTYSKNNILAQAGQSMLAQANSSNQGVLTLLQ